MIRLASLALLLSLTAAAPMSAQAVEAFGIKFVGTESTIRTDLPSEDPIERRGMGGVLFAEWNVPGPASLVTEAGYLERGYSRMTGGGPAMGEEPGHMYRLDRRMAYVSVAALARLPLADVGPVGTYAIGGPRMNALVGRSGEDSGGGMPEYGYNDVTWDATVGVGAELLRGLPVLVEARYNAGLNDAFSGEGWGEPAYHRAVDVMVGVKF